MRSGSHNYVQFIVPYLLAAVMVSVMLYAVSQVRPPLTTMGNRIPPPAGLGGGNPPGNTYYVDFVGGFDSNNGLTTSSPWQHAPGDSNAAGVPAVTTLYPGDTVQFKGGVDYIGYIYIPNSGTASNPITYKGTGWGSSQAEIDGANAFNPTWTQCANAAQCNGNSNYSNIYYANAPVGYKNFLYGLYENGNFMWYSQAPTPKVPFYWDNTSNWYHIPENSPTINITRNSIIDPLVFTQTDNSYWIGASIAIWVYPNEYTIVNAISYTPTVNTVYFSPTLPLSGSGSLYPHAKYPGNFTILNYLGVLNSAGEYYFNSSSNVIYVWANQSVNPSTYNFSVQRAYNVTGDVGIKINTKNDIVVEGFKVEHFQGGIWSVWSGTPTTGVTIQNNNITRLSSDNWYSIDATSSNTLITKVLRFLTP